MAETEIRKINGRHLCDTAARTSLQEQAKKIEDLEQNGTGASGADGFSPSASVTQTADGAVITITDKDGTTTAVVVNGKNGIDGKSGTDGLPGSPGQDGKDGIDGKDGDPGIDGYTPVKGQDYWTSADKAEIVLEVRQKLTPEEIGAVTADEVADIVQAETIARENAVADLKSQGVQQTPLFAESKEWLIANGDTSKIYLLPDGYLYAYKNVTVRNEVYVASEAEINMRHSHSSAAVVSANGYVITGYIDISEIMTRPEPKLSIAFGANKKSTARNRKN